MLELSFEKIVVIALVALFLVGPDQLPKYAAQLGRWVRGVRRMTDDAKRRLGDELGDDVAWEQLDPRRYTPRRMLQDAWNSEPAAGTPIARQATDDDSPLLHVDPEPQPVLIAAQHDPDSVSFETAH